ncbi:MAG: TlpA disulfide reductase family protein [Rikenellaceae bacterium]
MKKIILSLVALFAFFACRAQDDRGYLVSLGDQAPDIDLVTNDSTTVKLSDLRGKVVMLQFTATWCSVCLREMPHIEKDIWNVISSNPDFALYGVMLKQNFNDVVKMRSLTGVTYPLAVDKEGKAFYAYATKDAGVTRNVIIDKSGKIIFMTRLYDEKEFTDMVKVIKTELDK